MENIKRTGCTVTSEGMSDVAHNPLINFMILTPQGYDTHSHVHVRTHTHAHTHLA
jgi:hypothetical protein